jgi:hypothetical protein
MHRKYCWCIWEKHVNFSFGVRDDGMPTGMGHVKRRKESRTQIVIFNASGPIRDGQINL